MNIYIFKPTFLYVKTHNKTGLKYFGKTVKSNPTKYRGSGIHWVNHIKKHGNDVTTEIIGFYENFEQCSKAALQFSIDNDIVNSSDWANMIVENGVGGGIIGTKHSEETKTKIKNSHKGVPKSDEHRKNISLNCYGRTLKGKLQTEEHKRNNSEGVKRSWLNRPIINCPYCDISCNSASIMKRFHLDKCKHKPN